MKVYEGKLVSKKIKVGIVAARFNEFITSKLLSGALDTLKRHDVGEDDIDIAWAVSYTHLDVYKRQNKGRGHVSLLSFQK